jgi:hypothetical protein
MTEDELKWIGIFGLAMFLIAFGRDRFTGDYHASPWPFFLVWVCFTAAVILF